MITVGENKGFVIIFDCNKQMYLVYKDNRLLIKDKYRFCDVRCYLD